MGLQEHEEGIPIEQFDEKNIEIDFPDVDSMRRPTMLYIQPDYGTWSLWGCVATWPPCRNRLSPLQGAPNAILVNAYSHCTAPCTCWCGETRPWAASSMMRASRTWTTTRPSRQARRYTAIEASIDLQWSKEF